MADPVGDVPDDNFNDPTAAIDQEEVEIEFDVVDDDVLEAERVPVETDAEGRAEYRVIVHIVEGRDLTGLDRNGQSDPMVRVTCFGDRKHTDIKKKQTQPTWDTLLFFNPHLTAEAFNSAQINIACYDANTVFRDRLLGEFPLDLQYVYGQANHSVSAWVALTNPERGTDIMGYLKIAAVVLAPGDAPPATVGEGETEAGGDGESLQGMILLPPAITAEGQVLLIRTHYARDLPRMDRGTGSVDGYVRAKFASKRLTGTVRKDNYNPVFNEELSMPFYLPTMTDTIEVSMFDFDRGSMDEFIGRARFSLQKDVLASEAGFPPTWIHLYGYHKDKDGYNDHVLRGPSKYHGKLLMSMVTQAQAQPRLVASPIGPVADPPTAPHYLWVDVMEISDIDTDNKVYVRVEIETQTEETPKKKTKRNNCRMWESVDEIELPLSDDPRGLPDVFLSVFKKKRIGNDQRIGYVRLAARDLLADGDTGPIWYTLTPDGDNTRDALSGFILADVRMGRSATKPARTEIDEPEYAEFLIRGNIYQARGLPPGDSDAFSDPFCMIKCASGVAQTRHIEGTNTPHWYEVIEFLVDLPANLRHSPRILASVWDWDRGTKNELVGRCEIDVHDIGPQFDDPPTWHPLYFDNPAKTEGELLASFQIIPSDQRGDFPQRDITPRLTPCVVEVDVVGLRDLRARNIFGVKAPMIEFDLGDRAGIVRTAACSEPSPRNPNFLTTVRLEAELPLDPTFEPSLNVRVRDRRFGVKKMTLGTTTISLSPFLPWVDYVEEASDFGTDAHGRPLMVEKVPGAEYGGEEAVGAADGAANQGSSEVSQDEPDLPPEILANPDAVDVEAGTEVPPPFEVVGERTIPEVEETVFGAGAADTGAGPSDAVAGAGVAGTAAEEKAALAEDSESDPHGGRPEIGYDLEADLTDLPFREYTLRRGQAQKKKKFRRNHSDKRVGTGRLKARIRVYKVSEPIEPELTLEELFRPQQVVVRAYLLQGLQLVPQDRNGLADPYLKLEYGNGEKISTVDERKERTLRPNFYSSYEFRTTVPGHSKFKITVMDWDRVGRDEEIGSTMIDLEDRFFSPTWRELGKKPIEERALWTDSSSTAQGKLSLYVQILSPEEAAATPMDSLAHFLPAHYELRVIIHKGRNIAFRDKSMSDVIILGGFANGKMQKTDTHWRSTGEAEWFWRMKFPVELPCRYPRLSIRLFDRDVTNPNDAIAEAILNLKGFFKRARKIENGLDLGEQWVALTHPNYNGTQAEISIGVELLPIEVANQRDNGFGRSHPNQHPTLPDPVRPESFAPWRLDKLGKLWLKQHKWQIIALSCALCICCLLFVVLFIIL